MIITDSVPESSGVPRAFVPTMGALHEGHRTLMRIAREHAGPEGELVVSVFVNPLQFGAGEDFDKYPRTLEADAEVCAAEGVDVLYAPTIFGVYGESPSIKVNAGVLGEELEGAARPGHFDGVLTVVAILLHQVAPKVAVFGEKDYQQLELIRRMSRDLSFPVTVVGAPTVREDDGVALSSRNAYLSESERRMASAIPRALEAARTNTRLNEIRDVALTELRSAGLDVDYVEIRGVELGPAPEQGEARLLVAVHAGSTRLIDNCPVMLTGGQTP